MNIHEVPGVRVGAFGNAVSLTLPLAGPVGSSYMMFHARGARPPRGVILNVPQRPDLPCSFFFYAI